MKKQLPLICIIFLAVGLTCAFMMYADAAAPASTKVMTKANVLNRSKQPVQALSCLSPLLIAEPKNIQAYTVRATINGGMGRLLDAIADLTKALDINPRNADALANRGYYLRLLGSFDLALFDVNDALALDPGVEDTLWTKADTLEDLGLREEAVAVYGQLIALNPVKTAPWFSRFEDLEALHKFDLAQSDLQMVLQSNNTYWNDILRVQRPLQSSFNQEGKNEIDSQLSGLPTQLNWHPDGPCVSVSSEVDGRKMYLQVDTGATDSILFKQAEVDLSKIRRGVLKHGPSDKTKIPDLFEATTLRLGNLSLKNVCFVAENRKIDSVPFDGIICGNVLKNMVTTVDYDQRTITFAKSVTTKENALVVPLIERYKCPCCLVRINDQFDVLALIDTGAGGNCAPDALLNSTPTLPKYLDQTMNGQFIGTVKSAAASVDKIQIGTATIEHVPMEIFQSQDLPNCGEEIVLGQTFLQHFGKVVFDYPGKRLIFEPRGTKENGVSRLVDNGELLLSQQNYERAIKVLNQALLLSDRMNIECYQLRGKSYLQLGRNSEALVDFDNATRVEPNYFGNFALRAIAYERLGHYELALEDANRAIEMAPYCVDLYHMRATIYDDLDQLKLASLDYKYAKKISVLPQ